MTDLPNGWQAGSGEAARPLHDGGYYLHYYLRVLPGSNQHVTKTLELRVDTANHTQTDGPREHVVTLKQVARDDDGLIHERGLAIDTFDVEDRNDPDAQEYTEGKAHRFAHELMREYP